MSVLIVKDEDQSENNTKRIIHDENKNIVIIIKNSVLYIPGRALYLSLIGLIKYTMLKFLKNG